MISWLPEAPAGTLNWTLHSPVSPAVAVERILFGGRVILKSDQLPGVETVAGGGDIGTDKRAQRLNTRPVWPHKIV